MHTTHIKITRQQDFRDIMKAKRYIKYLNVSQNMLDGFAAVVLKGVPDISSCAFLYFTRLHYTLVSFKQLLTFRPGGVAT